MIKMRMGQENCLDLKSKLFKLLIEPVSQIRGVKDYGLLAVFPVEVVEIGLHHADHKTVDLDSSFIICHFFIPFCIISRCSA